MKHPLYQDNRAPETIDKTANAGLWFNKFFNAYKDDFTIDKEKPKDDKGKLLSPLQNWLKDLKGEDDTSIDEKTLKQNSLRQVAMLDNLKAQLCTFKLSWHFVTGMGNPHPVENGFTWHYTLGIPYIPGSAVKGIVRSWVEQWDENDNDEKKREKLLSWFGSDEKDAQTGNIIFFDAIPIEPPKLTVDIMTPHMGKWYESEWKSENVEKNPESVPADWHDPVPVPYLAVETATFLFGVALRKKDCDKIDINVVMKALKNALQWLGAGAKTAVGYGQMKIDDQTKLQKLRKEIQDQQDAKRAKKKFEEETRGLSDLAKQFVEEHNNQKWDELKDVFLNNSKKYLNQIEQEFDKDIFKKMLELMEKHYPKVMADPDYKKNKPNQKDIAMRLIKLKTDHPMGA